MIRIKLAIVDSDENYINKISNIFNASYSDKLELYSFTKPEPFLDFIRSNKVDVALLSDTVVLDTKIIPERTEFAYFVDSPNIDLLNNKTTVCKFQKIDLIYKAVLNLFSENPANVFGYKQGDSTSTNVLSFYSCSGGAGASTIAVACSLNLALKGKKVLYINLEQLGTPNIFFNAEGSFNLSDLIYAIKSKKTNISLKLESSVKKDKSGVCFIDESKTPLDLLEMTSEDIKKLIEDIKKSSLYDYIVIDTDMVINNVLISIMACSNNLIFISDGTENSNIKFKRLYKTFEIIESQHSLSLISKISVIYNKFNNNFSKYIDGVQNINVLGGIGEFSKAPSILIAQQISQMQIFESI